MGGVTSFNGWNHDRINRKMPEDGDIAVDADSAPMPTPADPCQQNVDVQTPDFIFESGAEQLQPAVAEVADKPPTPAAPLTPLKSTTPVVTPQLSRRGSSIQEPSNGSKATSRRNSNQVQPKQSNDWFKPYVSDCVGSKGLSLGVRYDGGAFALDPVSLEALKKLAPEVQRKVTRDLTQGARRAFEGEEAAKRAIILAEEERLRIEESKKIPMYGGERMVKWHGEWLAMPGTTYPREWINHEADPISKESWLDFLTQQGAYPRKRHSLRNSPAFPAGPATLYADIGKVREIYDQYQDTTRGWGPRWSGLKQPPPPGRYVSQVAQQDMLSLGLQGRQRMCCTPLGTLRVASRQSSRASSRQSSNTTPRFKRTQHNTMPLAVRSKSPVRIQLESQVSNLMHKKRMGTPVSRPELTHVLGQLAQEAHREKYAHPVSSRVFESRKTPPPLSPASCRYFGGRHDHDTTKNFRKTTLGSRMEMIAPALI